MFAPASVPLVEQIRLLVFTDVSSSPGQAAGHCDAITALGR
jgi:hypothetical protein